MNYGIYSILPSLAAIVLALVTKNVFIALFIALLLGNFILNPSLVNVLVGTKDMMVDVFSSHSSTSIIFILLMLGGLFYLIEKAGGLRGFTHFMIAKRSVVKSPQGRGAVYLAHRRSDVPGRHHERDDHRSDCQTLYEGF